MEEQFENVMREMHRRTKMHEPFNIHYDLWRGRERGQYYALLSFRNEDAFWHHQNAWYHNDTARLRECFASPVDIEFVDPVMGASTLPENDKIGREKAGLKHPESERHGY
jgi:hypothetical protein